MINKCAAASAIIVVCSLITTGCWDRQEVKNLAIVTATGLDYNKDGTYTQSVQIAIPSPTTQASGGGNDQKTFFVISAKGKTLADTRQHLQQTIHLKLYYSHRRVIIIGEQMARNGLEQVLDSFHREIDMRMRNMVFVTKGTDAAAMLKSPVTLESIPADQFRYLHLQPSGRSTTIMNFDATASSEGIDPTMGAFEVVQEHSSDESATSQTTAPKPRIKLYGVGIFKKLKLVGYLNDEETRALNWITGNITDSYLTTYIPQGHGNVSVHILGAKRAIHSKVLGKTIRMNVSVSGECELIEDGTDLDFSRPENVKLVNDILSSTVKRSIENSVKKTQQLYKADVFGFGRIFHAAHPQEWKQLSAPWSTLYPQVDVTVHTQISVIGSGFAKMPLYRNESSGEVK
ncbi:Ger(x)C family spore germination protein [Paenibacillus sp. R14(2021)]|uniref:Ger(x)C family spore germination protein n=1 Tax=Paenibacillus sp. R14(2021) TaxID=2859228 RepID=UPI001C612215|nr:Ger(x)C family spore germination protein [Paenibacillus sp. R14(2021)]